MTMNPDSIKDYGEPAFPVTSDPSDGYAYPGMTLRDYFAAEAMQALLSDITKMGKAASQTGQKLDEMIANSAYRQADAMLKARQS